MEKITENRINEKIIEIVSEVTPYIDTLDDVISKYTSTTNIYNMDLFETVKRELIDMLVHVSDAHGKLKYYHTMYDQGRKTIKAEIVGKIVNDQKKPVTFAKEAVYTDKEYRDYMKIQGLIEKAFQTVNSKYYLIDNTLKAVQQSIGVCRGLENK